MSCENCEERIFQCSDHEDRLRMAIDAKDWSEVERLRDEIADQLIRERAERFVL